MTLENARWLLLGLGLVMPYLARMPRGLSWLMAYVESGWLGFAMISLSNLVALLVLVGLSFLYQHPVSLLLPAVLLLGFLAFVHFSIDLSSDAQAGIGLLIFPVLAVPVALVGGLIGWGIDRLV